MPLQKKSFGSPDEVRPVADKGHIEIVKLGDGVVGKATFAPGWRWSEHVKPIAGTDSCQAAHFGYVLSGHQKVVMDDGSELEIGPGDVYAILPATTAGWSATSPACSWTSPAWSTSPSSGSPKASRNRSTCAEARCP